MHSNCKLALALVAGAAIGGAAIQTLHAQAKPPAFAVVEIDVTNQDAFLKEYSPIAGKALTEAGGKYLARGGRMLQSTASRRSREPLSSLLRISKRLKLRSRRLHTEKAERSATSTPSSEFGRWKG